jgi:riboflavin biosynthesis pyrimidine reductase
VGCGHAGQHCIQRLLRFGQCQVCRVIEQRRVIGVAPRQNLRGIDLHALLTTLHRDHSVHTVMVEAGPGLLGSLCEEDLIDEAVVYIAPLMLGDEQAKSAAAGRVAPTLSAGRRFDLLRVRALGNDVELIYRRPLRD